MNKWKKILFVQFGLVLGILSFVLTLNFIADPFNYNNYFDLGLRKDKISYIMNYRLYKLIKYKNNPKEIVVFGDSRGNSLREEHFEACGLSVANMSYGGGTLYEVIDTFSEVVKYADIKAAIFVIPFNIYNDNDTNNLIPQAKNIIDNPISYYLNFLTTKATIANLYNKLTGSYLRTEDPKMERELFWKKQLGESVTGKSYRSYKYPHMLLSEMLKIKKEAKKRDIKIILLSPPTHVELQDRINYYGLGNEYNKYKEDLSMLGDYMDYDKKNIITINKDNFLDPYHFNAVIADKIVKDICRKLAEQKNIHK